MRRTKIAAVVVFLAAMVTGPILYPGYYSGGVVLLLQKPTLWVKVAAALVWIVADVRERVARGEREL